MSLLFFLYLGSKGYLVNADFAGEISIDQNHTVSFKEKRNSRTDFLEMWLDMPRRMDAKGPI
jgi:hypothetical protein